MVMLNRKVVGLFFLLCLAVLQTSTAWSLTITVPKPNTVYHPGDTVLVKSQPSPGEDVKEVLFLTSFMDKSYFAAQPPFEFTFTVDADFMGVEKITAAAKLTDGSIVETEVQINVVLPSGVTLKSIKVYPETLFLFKLPSGSDPNRIRIAETESLGVSGRYSDGIERQITSSAAGTIYTTSDDKIATVSADGEVKAQGVGTATITVKNGDLKAVVKVIVKSKDR